MGEGSWECALCRWLLEPAPVRRSGLQAYPVPCGGGRHTVLFTKGRIFFLDHDSEPKGPCVGPNHTLRGCSFIRQLAQVYAVRSVEEIVSFLARAEMVVGRMIWSCVAVEEDGPPGFADAFLPLHKRYGPGYVAIGFHQYRGAAFLKREVAVPLSWCEGHLRCCPFRREIQKYQKVNHVRLTRLYPRLYPPAVQGRARRRTREDAGRTR